MRSVIIASLACAIVALALAAYSATRLPIYKHPTIYAVERLNREYVDRSRLSEPALRDLDDQVEIILSNEKVKDRAWSELWPLTPIAFLCFSFANLLVAALAYRSLRSARTASQPGA